MLQKNKIYGTIQKSLLFCLSLTVFSNTMLLFAEDIPIGSFDTKTGVYSVTQVKSDQKTVRQFFKAGQTRLLTERADLSEWTDGKGNPTADWVIKDGVISRTGGSSDLYLKGKYSSFVLEFEFKIEFKGNSGVFFFAWDEKQKARGFEYQIIDDANRPAHPYLPRYLTAGLYTLYHRDTKSGPMNEKDYNSGKIVVLGKHVELWLNGKTTVTAQMDRPEWNDRIKKSRHSSEYPQFGKMTTGQIALQNHDHFVWFRNIRLTTFTQISK